MDLAASEVQMIVSKTFARFGAESHDFEKREIFSFSGPISFIRPGIHIFPPNNQ